MEGILDIIRQDYNERDMFYCTTEFRLGDVVQYVMN